MWTPVVNVPTIRTNGEGNLVQTKKPTKLVFNNICDEHKKTFNVAYWIEPKDWEGLRQQALALGFDYPPLEMITVEFIPLGEGIMHSGYLEMDRK